MIVADAAGPVTAGAIRMRARRFVEIAQAANHAAARVEQPVSGDLRRLGSAYQAAAHALDRYAVELDGAHHRRVTIDDLVRASQRAMPHDPRSAALAAAHVARIRTDLLERLDRDLAEATERCAQELRAATPTAAGAAEVLDAVGEALEHARARLLQAAVTATTETGVRSTATRDVP